ncbi:MAG: AAA family ATPase [Sandaracinaceae bacterium]
MNNPVLVGPPGVGKTAIVEGLALRSPPRGMERLSDSILIEVSAGSLVSGTGVRSGALAEKLRQLRQEVAKADGKVLLFLDEIHDRRRRRPTTSPTSSRRRSRGRAAPHRRDHRGGGRRHFEKDPALVRRFSRIDVGEPSPADAIEILRGIAPKYEIHHAVAYEPTGVAPAVERPFASCPRGSSLTRPMRCFDFSYGSRAAPGRLRRRSRGGGAGRRRAGPRADRSLSMRDADRLLLELESGTCATKSSASASPSRASRTCSQGRGRFRGPSPAGTFLLLGPTGVGKTETAKAIADLLFPSAGITRFDMSELSEAHAVARLLGAPPGYVGHEEGGQLTEAVRRRPYQLVLLDEIEKAHPEVLLALLPLLDEGRLTDGRGRTVDFTNTVIVMTSNLGASAPVSRRVGFGAERDVRAGQADRDRALAAARQSLPPELWNRIDEPLWFAPLGTTEVRAIAERLLVGVAEVMRREHQIAIDVEPSAIDALIAGGGFDPQLGARPMRRCVSRLVEAPLASAVLAGEVGRGATVILRGEGERVILEPRPSCEAAE